MGELVKPLVELLNLCPSRIDNPVAATVHGAMRAQLRANVPGGVDYSRRDSGKIVQLRGDFRDIFYDRQEDGRFAHVVAQGPGTFSGLDCPFWQGASITLLCDLMQSATSQARTKVDGGKVSAALQTLGSEVRRHAASWYAAIFPSVMAAHSAMVAELGGPAQAKEQYKSMLTNQNFLTTEAAKALMGEQKTASWCWYHHWIKLLAMGASDEELAGVMARVPSGLVLPSDVGPTAWRGYTSWLAELNGSFIAEACRAGVAKPRPQSELQSLPVGFGVRTYYDIVERPDGFALAFLSGPGERLYNPNGSCFAPGTLIRMADARLLPIEAIQPGELVATPAGPRPVLLNVTTPRRGRPLYRFSQRGFLFSSSHPFQTAPGEHPYRLVAVDPAAAEHAMPGAARHGIGPLRAGTRLRGWAEQGTTVQRVQGLEQVEGELPEWLHDLVIAFDAEGMSSYYAGDPSGQFLAATELPAVADLPATTRVLLEVVPVLGQLLAEPRSRARLARAYEEEQGVEHLFRQVMDAALLVTAAGQPEGAGRPPAQGLIEPAMALAALFAATGSEDPRAPAPGSYDVLFGEIFARFVEEHAEELETAAHLGYRRILSSTAVPCELAVTLSSLLLHAGDEVRWPQDFTLTLTVEREGRTLGTVQLEQARGTEARYERRFDATGYFAGGLASGEPGARCVDLAVELRSPSSPGLVLRGRLSAFLPGAVLYRPFKVQVRDEKGSPRGTLRLDVRALSRAAAEDERALAASWTSQESSTFSTRLGMEFARALTARTTGAAVSRCRRASSTCRGTRRGRLGTGP